MTATTEELEVWCERHQRLFGINFAEDKRTVEEWTAEFVRIGYSAEELNASTTAMAALGEPVLLKYQLAWINDFIRRLRRRSGPPKRREPDEEHKFDQANYRKEIERLFPGHCWTTPAANKRKAKAS